MSDYVIIVIAFALLVAIVVTVFLRGKIKVWWKNMGVTAERKAPKGTSMEMEAHGPGSKIRRAKQIGQGPGDKQLKMKAREGGQLVDVEQRDESQDAKSES